jgi:hypothetical protein
MQKVSWTFPMTNSDYVMISSRTTSVEVVHHIVWTSVRYEYDQWNLGMFRAQAEYTCMADQSVSLLFSEVFSQRPLSLWLWFNSIKVRF